MKNIKLHFRLFIFALSFVAGFYTVALPQEIKIAAPVLSTIVIDPGHGGDDPGAVVQGVQEKAVVLDIALRLGKLIKEGYPGINVIFTRTTDVFIPLYERANIANKSKADLFISIHANYFNRPFISGTETFVLGLHKTEENLEVAKMENSVILLEEDYSTNYEGFDPNSAESYIMFELIQDEYLDQSIMIATSIQEQFTTHARRENRGVKQAGFIVLKRATMPSVLIETGFLSNTSDRKYLISDSGKNMLAISILKAFGNFVNKVENKTSTIIADKTEPDKKINYQEIPVLSEKSVDTQKVVKQDQKPAIILKSVDEPEKPVNLPKTVNESERPIILPKTMDEPEKKVKIQTINNNSEKTKQSPETEAKPVQTNDRFYSVQIAAVGKKIDTAPSNFKGEKNVHVKKIGVYYKYFSGKLGTEKEASRELVRLRQKFPGAFIVVFEADNVYPLKK